MLPPGLSTSPASGVVFAPGAYGNTVFAYLLPYLEQSNVSNMWAYTSPSGDGHEVFNNTRDSSGTQSQNAPTATVIKTFICPADGFLQVPFFLDVNVTGDGDADDLDLPTGYYGPTSYKGNAGTMIWPLDNPLKLKADGVFFLTGPSSYPVAHQNPVKFEAISDGLSNTLMFGEAYHSDFNFDLLNSVNIWPIEHWAAWGWVGSPNGIPHVLRATSTFTTSLPTGAPYTAGQPIPINFSLEMFQKSQLSSSDAFADPRLACWGSGHGGGANFAMCDGSVRFIVNQVDMATLQYLSTRGW